MQRRASSPVATGPGPRGSSCPRCRRRSAPARSSVLVLFLLRLVGPDELQPVGRGEHGCRGHHVARFALGLGRVAQARADEQVVRGAVDRDLDVEEVPVGDPDLLLDRDRASAYRRRTRRSEARSTTKRAFETVLVSAASLPKSRASGRGSSGGRARTRSSGFFSSSEYFAQHEGRQDPSAVGERRREEAVADLDGLLRGGGRRFGFRRGGPDRRPAGAGGRWFPFAARRRRA